MVASGEFPVPVRVRRMPRWRSEAVIAWWDTKHSAVLKMSESVDGGESHDAAPPAEISPGNLSN